MKRSYTGGCHCGAVRYEADLDLSQGTFRCNCSICSKGRAWLAAVPPGGFRLLQGEDALSKYQFNQQRIEHLFCSRCGIKSFAQSTNAQGERMHVVVVSCLDGIEDTELAALPVAYLDGRNDDFRSPRAETRHL